MFVEAKNRPIRRAASICLTTIKISLWPQAINHMWCRHAAAPGTARDRTVSALGHRTRVGRLQFMWTTLWTSIANHQINRDMPAAAAVAASTTRGAAALGAVAIIRRLPRQRWRLTTAARTGTPLWGPSRRPRTRVRPTAVDRSISAAAAAAASLSTQN